VDKVEEYTGKSAEDLTEDELLDAMDRLGIQKMELNDEDKAAIEYSESDNLSSSQKADNSYLDELERLADLMDRGVISEQDFEAKKKSLLNL
jgi:hypothetical protein